MEKAVPKGSYWTFGAAFSLKNLFPLELGRMSRANAETYEDIVRWTIKQSGTEIWIFKYDAAIGSLL
ncbi:hypothetical protein [Bacillus smithii]|uniref:hypothetical protein n=1 Tax=Bacillus smithii TaxID=1479 RepID=UPI0030EB6054